MAQQRCDKCGHNMDESNFYTYKDGTKTELCKKCLTMHIDMFNPETFMWVLEKMDVPYVPVEWDSLRDKDIEKKGIKATASAVFGKYLSKMKLKQWKEYGWADTERLQAESAEKAAARAEEQAVKDAYYQEQLEAGAITEAQYKTMVSGKAQLNRAYDQVATAGPYLGKDNPYNETFFIDESDLANPGDELTQEDKVYLAMKWGRLYKPSEWVELERMYTQMSNSFDIQDADSEATLILLCKTNLKQNQAIDSGDIEGFQKLSKVSESLRKTAKFTAAQNKEAKGDFVDSVGELIRLCETEGFIPRFCTDIPQDKVDVTLADQKEYIRKLVTQDLGFGQQIEDAIKKSQIQKEMNEAAERAREEAGDDYVDPTLELDDEDMAAFFEEKAAQSDHDEALFSDSEVSLWPQQT